MIVFLLLALLAVALGAAAAWLLGAEAGYVLIAWQEWTLESSIAGFVLLIIGSLLTAYLLVRGVSTLLRLPGRLQSYWSGRVRERAHSSFIHGVRLLAVGDYARAEVALLRRVADHEAPDLSYMAAARAAQELGAYDRRNHYLELANQSGEAAAPAVLAEQTRLYAAANEQQRALETARHFLQRFPQQPHATRLYAEALLAQGEHTALHTLLRERGEAIAVERRGQLRARAVSALMQEAVAEARLDRLKSLWDELDGRLAADPRVARAYAAGLVHLGAESEAVAIIGKVLKQRFDAELVSLFGRLEGIDPVGQLASLEQWLSQHGEEGALLLAAGRTCLRNRLWGKAKSYLDSALLTAPAPAVHQELARLAELTQRPDEALRHFREGLALATRSP
jgi:HemY protein